MAVGRSRRLIGMAAAAYWRGGIVLRQCWQYPGRGCSAFVAIGNAVAYSTRRVPPPNPAPYYAPRQCYSRDTTRRSSTTRLRTRPLVLAPVHQYSSGRPAPQRLLPERAGLDPYAWPTPRCSAPPNNLRAERPVGNAYLSIVRRGSGGRPSARTNFKRLPQLVDAATELFYYPRFSCDQPHPWRNASASASATVLITVSRISRDSPPSSIASSSDTTCRTSAKLQKLLKQLATLILSAAPFHPSDRLIVADGRGFLRTNWISRANTQARSEREVKVGRLNATTASQLTSGSAADGDHPAAARCHGTGRAHEQARANEWPRKVVDLFLNGCRDRQNKHASANFAEADAVVLTCASTTSSSSSRNRLAIGKFSGAFHWPSIGASSAVAVRRRAADPLPEPASDRQCACWAMRKNCHVSGCGALALVRQTPSWRCSRIDQHRLPDGCGTLQCDIVPDTQLNLHGPSTENGSSASIVTTHGEIDVANDLLLEGSSGMYSHCWMSRALRRSSAPCRTRARAPRPPARARRARLPNLDDERRLDTRNRASARVRNPAAQHQRALSAPFWSEQHRCPAGRRCVRASGKRWGPCKPVSSCAASGTSSRRTRRVLFRR